MPGTGEEPKAPVYVNGRLMTTLKGATIINDFIGILDEYLDTRFGGTVAKDVEPQDKLSVQ